MTRLNRSETPLESRFAEYLNFAKNHRLVTVILFFWLVASTGWSVYVTIEQLNVRELEQKVSDRDLTIQNKNAEIQRLETQLTPFRTIALQKFTGSEQEVLRKLANELENVKKATDIPLLTLMRERIKTTKNGSDYITSLVFRPSNRQSIGSTAFIARITGNTDVKIKEFKKMGITEGVKKSITRNGKEAIYNCDIQGYVFPEFRLVTTGPATVQLYGAHLSEQPVIFEVK